MHFFETQCRFGYVPVESRFHHSKFCSCAGIFSWHHILTIPFPLCHDASRPWKSISSLEQYNQRIIEQCLQFHTVLGSCHCWSKPLLFSSEIQRPHFTPIDVFKVLFFPPFDPTSKQLQLHQCVCTAGVAVFIYSMPGYSCTIRERMLYSTCKAPLLEMAEEQIGLEIGRKVRLWQLVVSMHIPEMSRLISVLAFCHRNGIV